MARLALAALFLPLLSVSCLDKTALLIVDMQRCFMDDGPGARGYRLSIGRGGASAH